MRRVVLGRGFLRVLHAEDLFDRQGTRVGTITLGNNRRVIGFGAGTVYVVAYDEFDLNYLERYAMPST